MKFNRNHTGKAGLFWILGLISILLVGCDAGSDTAKTSTAKTESGVASTVTPATAPALTPTAAQSDATRQAMPEVVMYKAPNCDCCTGWADHLRKEGFTVVVHKRDDMDAIKTRFGVSQKLASCHTAIVDGYVIEGHVPAADVERLLKERPDIAGLTAPGMPMKSPGMQKAGQEPQGYDVLAFDKDGKATVFHRY